MRGARIAEPLERKRGVGVFDSIAVTLWACLVAAGIDPSIIRGWGSVFVNPRLLSLAAPMPLQHRS
jgi:maleate isomerase